ncbi:MAG: VCBS repeat-containing protein [Ignavibacteria bacterium]
MKNLVLVIAIVLLSVSISKADEVSPLKKTFSKKDITNLSDQYINNNEGIKNPVIIDVDKDGDFDILKFTSKGNVEYYKNAGTLEKPFFSLENKNFDNYEVNSFLPKGLMMPVFFADRDGDKDQDVFAIVKGDYDLKSHQQKYETVYIENTMDLDNYTLITIILVLLVVALLVVIVR